MFLEPLRRRNPDFLRATVELHRTGEISSNSYVLDVDTIAANARLLANESRRLGLRVFAMTKQIGRNPVAIRAIVDSGIDSGVAVDMDCARALGRGGAHVGHLGHLVQVPRHEAREAAGMNPRFWTVFSADKAAEAARATAEAGGSQALLARIQAPGDRFYSGHEGGFPAADVVQVADALDGLEGAHFAGVTTFPALLFDNVKGQVRPTPNLTTVSDAAERLRGAGRADIEINAPGTTSVNTLNTLAQAGATQVEPGHALTGTTPWHAVAELPERPAMLYLTEISHRHAGRSFCFGGGLYVDPVFPPYQVRALTGSDPDEVLQTSVDAFLPSPDSIDYYGQLASERRTGDTVIFGFRAQAFVTRAHVVPVSGISRGEAKVDGVWTVNGEGVEEEVL